MNSPDPLTLWPWAEANQGLLSIAALAFALCAFFLESQRANRAEEVARAARFQAELELRREYIDAALGVTDQVLAVSAITLDKCAAMDPDETAVIELDDWNRIRSEAHASLEVLRASSPLDAALALALARLSQTLSHQWNPGITKAQHVRAAVEATVRRLVDSRGVINARKP